MRQGINTMLSRRHILSFAAATALSACATIPPPQLSRSQIEGLKIVSVEVTGLTSITSWPVEQDAFIAKGSVSQTVADDLRLRSYSYNPAIFEHFGAVIRQEYSNRLPSMLPGNRPVKAVVHVKQLNIPSLAARILVNQHALYEAEISLVEISSNQPLVKFDGKLISRIMIGGVGAIAFDVVTQGSADYGRLMIAESVADFRAWLNEAR
jgi:hypothetical protein